MRLAELSEIPFIYNLLQHLLFPGHRAMYRALLKVVSPGPGEKILDVGCGTGKFNRFVSKSEYTGIDTSPNYIRHAKSIGGSRFLVMDATRMTFPDSHFDKVVCINVFHHLEDETCRLISAEMARVCKPGGSAFILDSVMPEGDNYWGKLIFSLDRGRHQRTRLEMTTLMRSVRFAPCIPKIYGSFPHHSTIFRFAK